MGGAQSLPLPRYGCCIRPQNPNRCKENHSRMPKARGHRRNLSATFSFPEAENCNGNDLLNINTATEEELMTLPGINRQTAQNIVEYRRQIDGFRKVEDLALVSGVGATRLNHIRLELCVGKRGLSKNSSASSSGIDLSMHDNVSRGSAGGQVRAKVNVNTSNVFQLMKVQFISQYLAENIVAYRDRKGPFVSFDDLLKVKGIKPEVLSAIQPYLVLADGLSLPTGCLDMKTTSLSVRTEPEFNDTPCDKSREILNIEPFSERSVRNSSAASCTSQDCIRIASWNLDTCTLEKIENPGVREVIAMTILENGFGIVAFQDVTEEQALQKLVDELTNPTLANVKNWYGSRGDWRYIVSAEFSSASQESCHLAFLYDAKQNVQLINSGFAWTVSCSDDRQMVPLFLAEFKVHELDIAVANIYMEPSVGDDTEIEALVTPISLLLKQYEEQGSKNLLLIGHFGLSCDHPAMTSLMMAKFSPVLFAENFTDISTENTTGSSCTENMWISSALAEAHRGKQKVIREGLTSWYIPNGLWKLGGYVSTLCPIMSEFCVFRSFTSQESFQDLNENAYVTLPVNDDF